MCKNMTEIFDTWTSVPTEEDEEDPAAVYVLRMKPSGKELDPKMFDAEEKRQYD